MPSEAERLARESGNKELHLWIKSSYRYSAARGPHRPPPPPHPPHALLRLLTPPPGCPAAGPAPRARPHAAARHWAAPGRMLAARAARAGGAGGGVDGGARLARGRRLARRHVPVARRTRTRARARPARPRRQDHPARGGAVVTRHAPALGRETSRDPPRLAGRPSDTHEPFEAARARACDLWAVSLFTPPTRRQARGSASTPCSSI